MTSGSHPRRGASRGMRPPGIHYLRVRGAQAIARGRSRGHFVRWARYPGTGDPCATNPSVRGGGCAPCNPARITPKSPGDPRRTERGDPRIASCCWGRSALASRSRLTSDCDGRGAPTLALHPNETAPSATARNAAKRAAQIGPIRERCIGVNPNRPIVPLFSLALPMHANHANNERGLRDHSQGRAGPSAAHKRYNTIDVVSTRCVFNAFALGAASILEISFLDLRLLRVPRNG